MRFAQSLTTRVCHAVRPTSWRAAYSRSNSARALLIKPVAAAAGDTVCRHGSLVAINGRIVARASAVDAGGRPLPVWAGCFRLAADQIFVLSADPDSFDSRYMGPIDRAGVLGIAQPVWVRRAAPISVPGAS